MMHAYRTAIDMGIPVAGHSDSTISAADPLLRIIVLEATYLGGQRIYTAPAKAVAMIPQPPINYGDGDYGGGDEEENENAPD